MAYICLKPKNSCKTCKHFRYDEDRNRMACFAVVDSKKEEKTNDTEKKINI